jgi:HSP20 family protein
MLAGAGAFKIATKTDREPWVPWRIAPDERSRDMNQPPKDLRRTDLTRPPGASPFSVLRNDVEQIFNDFWRRNGWQPVSASGQTGFPFPSVDLSETNDGYRVTADLPGIGRDDVKIDADGNALVISGHRYDEREDKGRNWHSRECVTGEFRRTIELAEDADLLRANASIVNGVLTVNVPRNQEMARRRRSIPIEATTPTASQQIPTRTNRP